MDIVRYIPPYTNDEEKPIHLYDDTR